MSILQGLLILPLAFTANFSDGVEPVSETPTEETPTTETTTEVTTETTEEETEEETPTYECTLTENISTGGDVLFDITEGHVGDTVTAYVKPNFLRTTTSVKINGVTTSLAEDGVYKFEMVEGENTFDVEFEWDNEQIEYISTLINQAKDEGIGSIFTVDNLLTLLSWTISVLLSSGFFITLIKSKKLKVKTTNEVSEVMTNVVKAVQSEELRKFLENVMGETLDKITEKMDNVDECIKVLLRCFVLMQGEDADSAKVRLAIIEELTKLSSNDEALTNQIKAIVKEEQEAQRKAIEERDRTIEELKEANEQIEVEEEDDSYGQI